MWSGALQDKPGFAEPTPSLLPTSVTASLAEPVCKTSSDPRLSLPKKETLNNRCCVRRWTYFNLKPAFTTL